MAIVRQFLFTGVTDAVANECCFQQAKPLGKKAANDPPALSTTRDGGLIMETRSSSQNRMSHDQRFIGQEGHGL
jgi:hypothetical protein